MGDAAEMAFIELVDFDENMAKTPKAEKKTRRSRRSKKSADSENVVDTAAIENKTEPVKTKTPKPEEKPQTTTSDAEEPTAKTADSKEK